MTYFRTLDRLVQEGVKEDIKVISDIPKNGMEEPFTQEVHTTLEVLTTKEKELTDDTSSSHAGTGAPADTAPYTDDTLWWTGVKAMLPIVVGGTTALFIANQPSVVNIHCDTFLTDQHYYETAPSYMTTGSIATALYSYSSGTEQFFAAAAIVERIITIYSSSYTNMVYHTTPTLIEYSTNYAIPIAIAVTTLSTIPLLLDATVASTVVSTAGDLYHTLSSYLGINKSDAYRSDIKNVTQDNIQLDATWHDSIQNTNSDTDPYTDDTLWWTGMKAMLPVVVGGISALFIANPPSTVDIQYNTFLADQSSYEMAHSYMTTGSITTALYSYSSGTEQFFAAAAIAEHIITIHSSFWTEIMYHTIPTSIKYNTNYAIPIAVTALSTIPLLLDDNVTRTVGDLYNTLSSYLGAHLGAHESDDYRSDIKNGTQDNIQLDDTWHNAYFDTQLHDLYIDNIFV